MPGAPPGIYACAYRDLAGILVLLAEGRRALAAGNHTAAEARVMAQSPSRQMPLCACAVPELPSQPCIMALFWLHCSLQGPVRCIFESRGFIAMVRRVHARWRPGKEPWGSQHAQTGASHRSRDRVEPGLPGRAQARLRAAVAAEDAMGYMEPERQFAPVRLCLGAVLLRAGQPAAALQARPAARLRLPRACAVRCVSDACPQGHLCMLIGL